MVIRSYRWVQKYSMLAPYDGTLPIAKYENASLGIFVLCSERTASSQNDDASEDRKIYFNQYGNLKPNKN